MPSSLLWRGLLYASLIGLIVHLARNDFLFIPRIEDLAWFAAAQGGLFAGFFAMAWAFHAVVRRSGLEVRFSSAFAATGLSIFGKYLPGKVIAVLGPAAHLARYEGVPLARASYASTVTQVTSVWAGSCIAALSFRVGDGTNARALDASGHGLTDVGFALGSTSALAGLCGVLAVGGLALFLPRVHVFVLAVGRRLFRRPFEIPVLRFGSVARTWPAFLVQWLGWGLGFACLVASLSPPEARVAMSWGTVCAFPLAAVLGIVALFAPGGLGVREGLLTALLVAQGLPVELAGTIAVASRVWFLVGEVAIFVSALIVHRASRRHRDAETPTERTT